MVVWCLEKALARRQCPGVETVPWCLEPWRRFLDIAPSVYWAVQ